MVSSDPEVRLLKEAVINHKGCDLQHGADDLATARCADRKACARRRLADHRAVVAEAALTRRERVRFAGLRIEPHDAVIEQESGRG